MSKKFLIEVKNTYSRYAKNCEIKIMRTRLTIADVTSSKLCVDAFSKDKEQFYLYPYTQKHICLLYYTILYSVD